MSIKPVAWMHKDGSVITAEKKKKAEKLSSIQGAMVSGYDTPLIPTIPDTHRVVSVELLRRAEMSLCKEAQGAVTKEWDGPLNFAEQLRAIIEDKP